MKPFFFNSLDSPDRDKSVAPGDNSSGFPWLAFDAPDAPSSAAANTVESVYSAEDLASAVEEACQATALDVEARTRAAVTAELSYRQVQALEAIRDQLSASEADVRKRVTDVAIVAQSLAKMMGQTIVPKALERHPLADITEMLRQSLPRLVDQPSIELWLEAELVDQMADLFKDITDETGFQGELRVVAGPTLGVGEAKLVWKGGAAERDLRRIQEEVDVLVEAWLDNDAEDPSQDQASAMPESCGTEPDSPEEGVTS